MPIAQLLDGKRIDLIQNDVELADPKPGLTAMRLDSNGVLYTRVHGGVEQAASNVSTAATVDAATYDIDGSIGGSVVLTVDHETPVIDITGGAEGAKIDVWLVSVDGTEVVDITAFDWGDGTVTVLPLVAAAMVGFELSYIGGAWRAIDKGVIF